MMNIRLAALGVMALLAAVARAQEPKDYSELSRLIQQAAVEKCPKRFEDKSEWGRTIPPPPAVRMPRLRRAVVQVNGHDEFPDGTWKRTLVWLDDPAKDVSIRVLDVQQQETNRYRVKLGATVSFHGERERKRWKNGVQLFGLAVQADAKIAAELTCDVKITLDASKFPPDVVAEPKVVASRLELQEFDLNRVGNVLVGEPAHDLGNELKGLLQELVRMHEGEVKDYANAALAKALKGGQARIPATELLKLKAKAAEK
jgi:hypothetical protein